MIVRFFTKDSKLPLGLLIQKYENHYFGYIFNMDVEDATYGLESPKFKNESLKGLIWDFMNYYNNNLLTFNIQPIIGDAEYKEELIKELEKYNLKN